MILEEKISWMSKENIQGQPPKQKKMWRHKNLAFLKFRRYVSSLHWIKKDNEGLVNEYLATSISSGFGCGMEC